MGTLTGRWLALNGETQILVQRERVLAILYTRTPLTAAKRSIEFCWLRSEDPDDHHLLFDVTPGQSADWFDRWNRARAAVESALQAA